MSVIVNFLYVFHLGTKVLLALNDDGLVPTHF